MLLRSKMAQNISCFYEYYRFNFIRFSRPISKNRTSITKTYKRLGHASLDNSGKLQQNTVNSRYKGSTYRKEFYKFRKTFGAATAQGLRHWPS